MSDDRANIEISATTSKLASGLRRAGTMVSAFASTAARGVGTAFSAINSKLKLGEVGKNAAGHLMGNVATRGLDALTEAATDVRDLERNLTRYNIAASGSQASLAGLRGQISQVSRDTGIAREELLGAAQAYVDLTDDADGASRSLASITRFSIATGVSMQTAARMAGEYRGSLGIAADQTDAMFDAIIKMNVSAEDAAEILPKLAADFGAFDQGVGAVRSMSAAFSTLRPAAGSSKKAASELEGIMAGLGDADVLRKLKIAGVRVVDKNGNKRASEEILEDIVTQFGEIAKKKKVSVEQVAKVVFGGDAAAAGIRTLAQNIGKWHELRAAAKQTGETQRRANEFLESDAGRLDRAMNNLKLTIAEAFTPERIAAFTSAVESLVAKMGPLVDLFGKAGDLLGGLYGVGKSIRGALTSGENGNPFRHNVGKLGNKVIDDREGDSERKRNAAGYDRAVADILGGEVNDRTSQESIRRAVVARYAANNGAATAGNRYLANAFGSGEEVAAAVDKVLRQIAADTAKQASADAQKTASAIASAITGALGAMTVDISRDKVVDATRNSAKNRTRP